MFPSGFAGLAFAMIVIGALVPASSAGLIVSIWTYYVTPDAATKQAHWGGSGWSLGHLGLHTHTTLYIGFVGVVVNLVIAFGGTAVLKALRVAEGTDETAAADYFTDVADTKAAEPAVTAGT